MAVVTRNELEEALAELAAGVADPRAGILGPSSLTWELGGDLAVFLGSGRAALLQLAHPMVAHAIDHHSATRADVLGRFERTFRNVFAMVFGDLDHALSAARRVHNIHTRVQGVIPDAVGRWPAGTLYYANDAEALLWVHTTLVDTMVVVRELLYGELPIEKRDAFLVEASRTCRLFGIPWSISPSSWAEHERYVNRMLTDGSLAVAPCAREMAKFLMGRGAGPQTPLGRVIEVVTSALLPPRLVEEFGLYRSTLSASGVRVGLRGFGPLYRRLPRALVSLPACSDARRRIAGKPPTRLAAWTERTLSGMPRWVTGS